MEVQIPESALFIGGRWQPAAERGRIPVEDPSTGSNIGDIQAASRLDIDAAVAAARAALAGPWGATSPADRGRLLTHIGRAVAERLESLAQLEALDVGKPISQARADVRALARYLEFYGGATDKMHGDTIPYLPGYTVFTQFEPFGVTGHIIPWNYPMQIIGRSVIAALAMGNAAVLKPAEQASFSSLAFARIAHEAGLPPGALNVVTGSGAVAGHALAAHAGVNHLSFTGSTAVGAAVQVAAAAHSVPVTLELGGKSPHIVFDDADIEAAQPLLVLAAVQNAGQTCSAGSRILVQRRVYGDVLARLAARFSALRVGPPSFDLELGALISGRQKARVEEYIETGRRDFQVAARGRIVEDVPAGGYYVAPTLFADVAPGHRIAQEEIFGPVAVLIPFDSDEEAVTIANGTPYGLVAGVWSQNHQRLMRMARQLKAGQVYLNDFGAAGGVELPFGGVGRSGFGREKGMEALRSFSALKTVISRHG
jgi:aldehyde dehydrogenase (NAD+)